MHFLSLISLEIIPFEEPLVTGPFLHSHIKIYWDEQMVVSIHCALFNSYSVFMADYFFAAQVLLMFQSGSLTLEKSSIYIVYALYTDAVLL